MIASTSSRIDAAAASDEPALFWRSGPAVERERLIAPQANAQIVEDCSAAEVAPPWLVHDGLHHRRPDALRRPVSDAFSSSAGSMARLLQQQPASGRVSSTTTNQPPPSAGPVHSARAARILPRRLLTCASTPLHSQPTQASSSFLPGSILVVVLLRRGPIAIVLGFVDAAEMINESSSVSALAQLGSPRVAPLLGKHLLAPERLHNPLPCSASVRNVRDATRAAAKAVDALGGAAAAARLRPARITGSPRSRSRAAADERVASFGSSRLRTSHRLGLPSGSLFAPSQLREGR